MSRYTSIIVVPLQEIIANIYRLLLRARVGQLSMSLVVVQVHQLRLNANRFVDPDPRMCEKYNQYPD